MRELIWRLWNEPASVRKFIAAFIGAVVVAVSLGLLPETVGPWLAVISAFASSIGVYAVANKTQEEE